MGLFYVHGLHHQRLSQVDCWEAWSTVLKGSLFPHAVVLGWEMSIFHHVDLLQVPLPLPDAFA